MNQTSEEWKVKAPGRGNSKAMGLRQERTRGCLGDRGGLRDREELDCKALRAVAGGFHYFLKCVGGY